MRTKQFLANQAAHITSVKEMTSIINTVLENSLGIYTRDVINIETYKNSILELNNQFIQFLRDIDYSGNALLMINFVNFLSKCNKDDYLDNSLFNSYKNTSIDYWEGEKKFSDIIPAYGNYKKYFMAKYCNSLEITTQDSTIIKFFKTIVNRDESSISNILDNKQINQDHASDVMFFLALDSLNCADYSLFQFTLIRLTQMDLTKAFRLSIFDNICSQDKILGLFSPISEIKLNLQQKEILTNQVLTYDATIEKINTFGGYGFNSPKKDYISTNYYMMQTLQFDSKYLYNLQLLKDINSGMLADAPNSIALNSELKDIHNLYKRTLESKELNIHKLFNDLKKFQYTNIFNNTNAEYRHKKLKFEKILCEDMLSLAKYTNFASNWHEKMLVCKNLDQNLLYLPKEIWRNIGHYLANMLTKGTYWTKCTTIEEQTSNPQDKFDKNFNSSLLIMDEDILENSDDDSDYMYKTTGSSSEGSIMSLEEVLSDTVNDSSEQETIDIVGNI